MKEINPAYLKRIVQAALSEDRACDDISTLAVGCADKKGQAMIMAKQEGVISGLTVAMLAFKTADNRVRTKAHFRDGDRIYSGDKVISLKGPIGGILRAERTALNFLGHLSGISTLTARFVQQLEGTSTCVLDTRKTLPGLRDLEKYAVVMGGGKNHRRDLSDMYLLKENHIAAAGGMENALHSAILHRKRVTSRRKSAVPKIEVEVVGFEQLRIAMDYDIDRIMLDNFTPQMVREAVEIAKHRQKGKKRVEFEVSGGINLANIRQYARTGVDFISVGALTHSAPAFDFSLLIELP